MPQSPPQVISEVMLSKEFGWTPTQIANQSNKKIQEYIIVLNELSRHEDKERKKHERKIKTRTK